MLSFFRATPDHPYGYWLPLNLSVHGAAIDRLINWTHLFLAVLFFGWAIYLIYVLVRFRARPGQLPLPARRFRLPVGIEVAVVVVELVLFAYLSTPIWLEWKQGFPDENRAVRVRVVAQQFTWLFHYPGGDGLFGKTRLELVEDENPLGLDRSDPAAKDDLLSVNHLHIPVHRPIIAYLSSKDVIHSFYLPVLRVKQDAVPGMTIPVWFEATGTGQRFEIACAQLCGNGHANMRGYLHIDTAEEFASWLKQQAAANAGGAS